MTLTLVFCGLVSCPMSHVPCPKVQAALSEDMPAFDTETYTKAMEGGVEAFREGDLNEAARAFQEAYVIRPTDPVLVSWMSLVRDEQARRTAMTREMDAVQRRATGDGKPSLPREPLWRRLTLSKRPPLGVEDTVTPVGESRPEVLTDTKRAGFQKLYKEGIGFQPIRGLGLSGRTEIFEEPNPVEDYVLESNILNFNEISQFRRSIVPLFTRSAAGRIVADYEPLPRLTYEYDTRETFNEFTTRYAFEDIQRQTHAINALYSFPRLPLLGLLTVNPWYKRVIQRSDHDAGSYEHRNQTILNLSLQPTDTMEYFFQFDGYDAVKVHTIGGSKLKLFKAQVRLRFPQWKLFLIPSVEYSDTDFDPSDDEFIKKDLFLDWGMDLTKRLRFSSKEQLVLAETVRPGNQPSNPDAEVYNTLNTLSYELFKDFDVSIGLDYSRAAGINSFNNVGFRAEMELFKPGLIRSKVGYEWLSYYNISDSLSLLYWKFFLFQ